MKSFWWIFVLALVCAVLSKQIDQALAKRIMNEKKRAIAYCVTGTFSLSVIGVLIYKATSTFAGDWSVVLAIAPVSLFMIAVGIGTLVGRFRNKKRNGD